MASPLVIGDDGVRAPPKRPNVQNATYCMQNRGAH